MIRTGELLGRRKNEVKKENLGLSGGRDTEGISGLTERGRIKSGETGRGQGIDLGWGREFGVTHRVR